MPAWPDTQPTLVTRIANPRDDAAWHRFDSLYRPVIYRYARARGLQHSDSESLVCDVMSRVFKAAQRWSSGDSEPSEQENAARPLRFRAWLQRIAENALLNLVTRQLASRGTGGTSHQLELDRRAIADDASKQLWQQQHRQHVFMTAAAQVQNQVDIQHWQAFWMTHVDGVPIAEAARQLQRSVGSIYAIRSRVLRLLRGEVLKMESLEKDNQDAGLPGESNE